MSAFMKRKCNRSYFLQASLLLITWLILETPASSQAPAIQWQKNYGGSFGEQGISIQQTTDGGYIMIGTTVSSDIDITLNHGLSDCWVIKSNSTGNIEWQKIYGGTNYETGFCIRQTADGGYVFVGTTWSTDGDLTLNQGFSDVWVVKLNNTGIIEWQKTYGGTYIEEGFTIEQTVDGGYVVAGSVQSADGDVTFNHGSEDYWLIKLNNMGVIQWQKTYGGDNADRGVVVRQTTDGGYIMAGHSRTPNNGDVTGNHSGSEDYWIVKTNSSGTIEWQNSFGGDDIENGYSICQTTDGGYIVAGQSYSVNGDVSFNHGNCDYWVVKLNSAGTIEWQKSYGGADFDEGTSIYQTPDGGYILGGSSFSNDGDVTGNHSLGDGADYWIVKLNATGTIQWQKALGGTADDRAFCAVPTADGGYIITGFSPSNDGDVGGNYGFFDFWTVKLLDVSLPVELISFTAKLINKTVELNWQTAQEMNTSLFVIERSNDGLQFNFLKQINAAGNSLTIRNYKAIDAQPLTNNSFYRLKQIDLDGKFTYSKIVRIFNGTTGFSIHNSQSVKDILTVQWSSLSRSKGSLQIIDITGKVVLQKQIAFEARENNISLPVGHLANGIYVLSLVQDNSVESKFFLKK